MRPGRSVSTGAGALAVPAVAEVEANPAYNVAVTFMRVRQYDRAIAEFTKAIQSDPKLTKAYYNRGVCYMNIAKYKAAIADFTVVLERDPTNINAHYNRGVSYMNIEEPKAAVEDLTFVIYRAPTAEAYRNRARAKATLGNIAGANADFAEAEKIDQKHSK